MPASSDDSEAATVSAVATHIEAHSPAPDPRLIADLVTANHILYDQRVVDAFGHVSVRHDKRRDRFLLARSMAPALVTAADILEFDLDGNPLDAGGKAVYLERFIHGEIYRVRPDVVSIVHSHSRAVIRSAWCVRISCAGDLSQSGFGRRNADIQIRGARRRAIF